MYNKVEPIHTNTLLYIVYSIYEQLLDFELKPAFYTIIKENCSLLSFAAKKNTFKMWADQKFCCSFNKLSEDLDIHLLSKEVEQNSSRHHHKVLFRAAWKQELTLLKKGLGDFIWRT